MLAEDESDHSNMEDHGSNCLNSVVDVIEVRTTKAVNMLVETTEVTCHTNTLINDNLS